MKKLLALLSGIMIPASLFAGTPLIFKLTLINGETVLSKTFDPLTHVVNYENRSYDIIVNTSSGTRTISINDVKNIKLVPEKEAMTTPTPGDANNDGLLSVADISMIASYILSEDNSDINLEAADVNKDGTITVADLSMLAQKILNQ